jgi:hypothetical protein
LAEAAVFCGRQGPAAVYDFNISKPSHAEDLFMGRYDDDYHYDQRRQDRIAGERRFEQRRMDALAEERRRDERRQDYIDEDNRRQEREDREKSQKETNDLAMSWLRLGNAEAAAAIWGLNLDRAAASSRPSARPGPKLSASRGSVPGITWLKWAGGPTPDS